MIASDFGLLNSGSLLEISQHFIERNRGEVFPDLGSLDREIIVGRLNSNLKLCTIVINMVFLFDAQKNTFSILWNREGAWLNGLRYQTELTRHFRCFVPQPHQPTRSLPSERNPSDVDPI